jgi:formylglycine-generating enzyme required for sulfatase activity
MDLKKNIWRKSRSSKKLVPQKAESINHGKAPEALTGSVIIESTPAGAEVFLDGKKIGLTPLNINDLKSKLISIRLTLAGYHPQEKQIGIKNGKTVKFSTKLKKITGQLLISSNPTGANVFINGKFHGKTEIQLSDLTPGKALIKLEKDGYQSIENEIMIRKGKTITFSQVLESNFARVKINSTPPGARWYLDDVYMGETPDQVNNLEPGKTHEIKITKKGYLDWRESIGTKKGKTRLVNSKLILDSQNKTNDHSSHIQKATYDPKTGRIKKLESNTHGDTWTHPKTGIKFIWLKGGCFQMGSPVSEKGHDKDEGPVHEVCVDGFWLSKHETTQYQWYRIMKTRPSGKKYKRNFPVNKVSWDDTKKFIRKLNNKSKENFRLPTESEWEYAARAGSQSAFENGKIYRTGCENDINLSAIAWYCGNSRKKLYNVGKKQANKWGLYDMNGNVWEWCQDWYGEDYYSKSSRNNPKGPESGSSKIIRGGAWNSSAKYCRSANRDRNWPGARYDNLGFRLIRK